MVCFATQSDWAVCMETLARAMYMSSLEAQGTRISTKQLDLLTEQTSHYGTLSDANVVSIPHILHHNPVLLPRLSQLFRINPLHLLLYFILLSLRHALTRPKRLDGP